MHQPTVRLIVFGARCLRSGQLAPVLTHVLRGQVRVHSWRRLCQRLLAGAWEGPDGIAIQRDDSGRSTSKVSPTWITELVTRGGFTMLC